MKYSAIFWCSSIKPKLQREYFSIFDLEEKLILRNAKLAFINEFTIILNSLTHY